MSVFFIIVGALFLVAGFIVLMFGLAEIPDEWVAFTLGVVMIAFSFYLLIQGTVTA